MSAANLSDRLVRPAGETAAASQNLPERFESVEAVDDALSAPTDALVRMMKRLEGPILILGVGGKMGPTLARMARRADEQAGVKRRIIGVSRFGSGDLADRLNGWGIETVAADLLNEQDLARLPDAPNIVYMPGFKFGASDQAARTWAMNVLLPGMVCRRFPQSRIVAFSSGNVYPIKPLSAGGSRESDTPGPIGEYAMTCLGRERAFEHYSRTTGQPMAIIRLSYACELRYGVLVDIAQAVWNRQPISVTNSCFKVIWQADANEMTLRAFEYADSPPLILNVAGPETLSFRQAATQFGNLMDRQPLFEGSESESMRLTNAQLSHRLFGYPRIGVEQMMHWIADWVMRGGDNLGKPVHFEVRDGKY